MSRFRSLLLLLKGRDATKKHLSLTSRQIFPISRWGQTFSDESYSSSYSISVATHKSFKPRPQRSWAGRELVIMTVVAPTTVDPNLMAAALRRSSSFWLLASRTSDNSVANVRPSVELRTPKVQDINFVHRILQVYEPSNTGTSPIHFTSNSIFTFYVLLHRRTAPASSGLTEFPSRTSTSSSLTTFSSQTQWTRAAKGSGSIALLPSSRRINRTSRIMTVASVSFLIVIILMNWIMLINCKISPVK